MSLAPDDCVRLNTLGIAELRGGRPRRAMRAFATALAVDPTVDMPAHNLPLAMFGVVRRVGVLAVVFLLLATSTSRGISGRVSRTGLPAVPGLPCWAHLVAGGFVLANAGLLVWSLTRAIPPLARPIAGRALRRSPQVWPRAVAASILLGLAVLVVAVPVPYARHALPALVLGVLVQVTGALVSRTQVARRGREQRAERTALWQPPSPIPPHPTPRG